MNQPYQRVTNDSVWNGAAVGAAAGAGGIGAAHYFSKRAHQRGLEAARDRSPGAAASAPAAVRRMNMQASNYANGAGYLGNGAAAPLALGPGGPYNDMPRGTSYVPPTEATRKSFYGKHFGSGKGAAVRYAAGILGMGLVGAGIDSLNKG
ncbi:hypothetical protein GZH47_32815 (plasmid) [Paenibacillus rhizovicinus]|uniref:Uncharacterized protein n=1 Tax=Paenibacillus rhizovicinus TaxID=2704463 RepID=A0A6C0PCY1_9BACL|nr:hypothetical protein [Paenibacillus rhizovicinus]QHW35682.1 hypothetical protein GZH47_32815 [Paenibacillus rhizovicinus]